ncbi:MAG: hypothetical protein M3R36_13780 [Bacteroidota bacterium]|nr:hypothetical protein [Bacteroidota bacterium]
MKKIKIFLASSNELKAEREQFEIEINRKNKAWFDKGIYLHLDIWEDLSARMSSGGSQSEYNKYVQSADFFVLLAFTKVGKYTEEEFENASTKLKSSKTPFIILTYFKNTIETAEDSLIHFKKKLEDQKHFFSPFTDYKDLWIQFDKELERIDLNKFGENKSKAFNEILTRRLMDALSKFNGTGKEFLEQANEEAVDWEAQSEKSEEAQYIITRNFGGVIGIQLSALVSIAKNDEYTLEVQQKKYIENCLITAKRALQLVCFSLLSKLWDYRKESKYEFTEKQNEVLRKFFGAFELEIERCFKLLECLIEIFVQNKFNFPLADEKTFTEISDIKGEFRNACSELHKIQSLDSKEFTLLTCFEAEKYLTILLENLIFFTNYKMISIKSVEYHRMRNNTPHYLHNYSDLGIKNRNTTKEENVNYVKNPISTDAILLYKERYQDSVNLFPFIIDYNALTVGGLSKICFYNNKDSDGNLNYRILEDNKILDPSIAFMDTLKSEEINTIMMDDKKRKQLKLNEVFSQFEEAKKIITGKLK